MKRTRLIRLGIIIAAIICGVWAGYSYASFSISNTVMTKLQSAIALAVDRVSLTAPKVEVDDATHAYLVPNFDDSKALELIYAYVLIQLNQDKSVPFCKVAPIHIMEAYGGNVTAETSVTIPLVPFIILHHYAQVSTPLAQFETKTRK